MYFNASIIMGSIKLTRIKLISLLFITQSGAVSLSLGVQSIPTSDPVEKNCVTDVREHTISVRGK